MKPDSSLLVIISSLILLTVTWGLPTWVTSTPTPTLVPTCVPTPTQTPTPDLEKDVFMAPSLDWVYQSIWNQFPSAEIWPSTGVERRTRLYRLFKCKGEEYMAIFELGEGDKWKFLGAVKMGVTPTLPSAAGQEA